jgi:hypothetical protein
MSTPFPNGKVVPQLDKQVGTEWDLYEGPLLFGLDGKEVGEVFDYREPTVPEIKTMLDQDGKAQSLESVITLPIRAATWSIVPTDRSDVSEKITELLTTPSADGGMKTPLSRVIAQMTSAFAYRRTYFEKVFTQTPDNKIGYSKLAWRPPDTCILLRDPVNGSFQGFKQMLYPYQLGARKDVGTDGYVTIPTQYSMVYIHGQHKDPTKGISDFQVPWWCYTTKQKVLFLWFTYLETQSLPRTIVQGKNLENVKKAARVISALKNHGVAGIETGWIDKMDQLQGQGSAGAAQFNEAITYLDSQASMSLLAGFVDLPARAQTGVGSYALSASQQDLFLQLLQGYAGEMEDVITNYVIADLVRYNFGSGVQVPRFEFAQLNREDIQPQTAMLQAVMTSQTTNPAVPTAFINDLVMAVSQEFGFDTDEMSKAIDEVTQKLEQAALTPQGVQVAPMAAAANVTAREVQNAQQQQSSPTAGVAAPTGSIPGPPGTSPESP